MYENREPRLKEWDVVLLRKSIVCDFDSGIRVFVEFVEDCSKPAKWKTHSDGIAYDIWRGGMICCRDFVFVVYGLMVFYKKL